MSQGGGFYENSHFISHVEFGVGYGFSRVLITKTISLVVYVIVSGHFSEVMVKNRLICTEILNI